jgi:ADP-ribose pyrophosphatase
MKKLVTKGKIFNIYEENISLNGRTKTVETISLYNDVKESVMVAPFVTSSELILIEEYCPAMNKNLLIFPGGIIDEGETRERAAIRELEEEIKYSPQNLIYLTTVDIFPKYMLGSTHLFIGKQLIVSENKKDEFSQIRTVKKSLAELKKMINKGELQDSRTLALALLVISYFEKN